MKIGLKLWSTNDFYIEPAVSLFESGKFDYIELFVESDSLDSIPIWKDLKIPYVLHAPHSMSGLNPSRSACEVRNFELIGQVDEYRKALKPKYIIFHPGSRGTATETIRQFCEIREKFPDLHRIMLVENKPMKGLKGERCVGFAPAEVERIAYECGIEICLDFGHAVAASNSFGIPWEIIITEFLWQEPAVYHFSDGDIKAEIDAHWNLGKGTYPLAKFAEMMPGKAMVTLETEKSRENKLNDFVQDTEYLAKLL